VTALRFRQIHLDFHTSEKIAGVGSRFDAVQFADTLSNACVDSVTCFARCHHGRLYYPSKQFAHLIHPHLANHDLLIEQIKACHARDIRVPAYVTVQWDAVQSADHPEWLLTKPDGSSHTHGAFDPGFYRHLDVLHPGYRQFLKDQVVDLLECVPDIDGLFFDIVQTHPSSSPHWIKAMQEVDLDPSNEQDRQTMANRVIDDWQIEMSEFCRALPQWTDDKTIFYNAGHVGPRHRFADAAFSHYEVESLPSGGWGYLHFPLAASYARTLGKPTLGMTGKFHTMWGDFHSYKNQAALDFEGLRTVAFGSSISVGDQLPPNGELDGPTYERIGKLFCKVRELEPWLNDTQPVPEVAILTPESVRANVHPHEAQATLESDSGAVRLMTELRRSFDRIDEDQDFTKYPLLILPDGLPINDELDIKLQKYIDQGGKLIVSGEIPKAAKQLGLELQGPSPTTPDFVVPSDDFASELPRAAHVMYDHGQLVNLSNEADTQVLATIQSAEFTRTWEHYCSHLHAPSNEKTVGPAVVQTPKGVYFAHDIFKLYHRNAARWIRLMLEDAMRRTLAPLVETGGPVGMTTSLMHQPEEKRYLLHLLYYPAERKAMGDPGTAGVEIIEEAVPVHELAVKLRLPASAGINISKATLQPAGTSLSINQVDGAYELTLPILDGHAMIEWSYA